MICSQLPLPGNHCSGAATAPSGILRLLPHALLTGTGGSPRLLTAAPQHLLSASLRLVHPGAARHPILHPALLRSAILRNPCMELASKWRQTGQSLPEQKPQGVDLCCAGLLLHLPFSSSLEPVLMLSDRHAHTFRNALPTVSTGQLWTASEVVNFLLAVIDCTQYH